MTRHSIWVSCITLRGINQVIVLSHRYCSQCRPLLANWIKQCQSKDEQIQEPYENWHTLHKLHPRDLSEDPFAQTNRYVAWQVFRAVEINWLLQENVPCLQGWRHQTDLFNLYSGSESETIVVVHLVICMRTFSDEDRAADKEFFRWHLRLWVCAALRSRSVHAFQ